MKQVKRSVSVIVLLLLLIGVTVGYSVLSQTLNINGTSRINVASWDVHFANVQVTTGSVTATTAPNPASNNLTLNYAVNLNNPGDFYEFTVDVTNAGSVPAKLSALPTISGVSTAQDVYVNYTFTHTDGTAIVVGETIAAGASKNFKVRVEFDRSISQSQLPTSAQNLTLTASMNYEQA